MIRYALTCQSGHEFDVWFGSSTVCEEQVRGRAISCPECGSVDVRKAPMAPAVKRNRAEPSTLRQSTEPKKTYALLKGLRAHLEANAENVGPAFSEEARKMHYGEAETRSIYGEASLEEAKASRRRAFRPSPCRACPRIITDRHALHS